MRAGLNTIQQTLTPEAANVLNLSIAEAGRRNHGQTTPLHVAATLLSSPSGYLRQACIRSHPNSSHPLQCRALELCFSVALERLPTSQSIGPGMEPPISNALMAALKRAQAHQRRGCPEQQQQPLLAVKVELEQLIISILDDPSVSRVMREASFSSPAVKATIEQTLNSQPPNVHPSPMGIGFRPSPTPVPVPARNLYLNPRLQQGIDEIKRITDILLRTKKSNPVLVGDSEPDVLIKELLRKIERGELGESPLKSVQVIPLEKEFASDKLQIPAKLNELGGLIEAKMGSSNGGGIILDLGDLKWLVEQPGTGGGATAQQVVPETGRAAVEEMGKLLSRFRDGGGGRLWLIGTATCETYLRCQVYHPSMENDWDLQAVPVASRSPIPGMFPRFGSNGILGSSIESLSPLKGFPPMTTLPARRLCENLDPARRMRCCPQCTENYEKELAKSVAEEKEKSCSDLKSEAARPALPQWLQSAKVLNGGAKAADQLQNKDQDIMNKQKSQEVQKKWVDTCLRLHPNFHRNLTSERIAPPTLSMSNLYNPKLLSCQPFPQKLQLNKNHGESLRLNSNPVTDQPTNRAGSPPGSPVRTDLALGPKKVGEMGEKDRIKDLLGCITSESLVKFPAEKFADPDAFKKLLKGLLEKVWWQQDAASAVATTVTKCRLGNGRRRGNGIKGDMWLLFTGPDRVGKKKMAAVLSEQICGASPVTICLGSRRSDEELEMKFRGKTVLDRIVEAIRRNPFSVIILQDIDEADMIVRGNIKRAMDRGRLADSHGREISLGNVIFILTSDWLPENLNKLDSSRVLDEKKLESTASGGWQLRISVSEKSAKRRANWLHDEGRATKPRMESGSGLSFDLNLAADTDEDRGDGSNNSSDLTIDHEDDHGLENMQFPITTIPRELVSFMDDGIVIFKPVKLAPVRGKVRATITEKFSTVVEDKISIELEEEALERILAGVWLGRVGLEEWSEKVLIPSFQQLKQHLSSDDSVVVRLECGDESGSRSSGDWLPSALSVRVGE